jgi:protein ImuB
MPLAEAAAIVKAHFEEHDPHADHAMLLQLAAWCEQFSPVVGTEQSDNLFLDITGIGSLFGSEESLAQQVLKGFQKLGYIVRISIADTAGAAWAISHFDNETPVTIPPQQTIERLSALPIASLRLTDQINTLAELGIERVEQLMALPRAALASRFDPQLLLRLDQTTGLVPEPIISHRPPPDITIQTHLEYPTADRQVVDFVLAQLMDRIIKGLIERQQGAIQLECNLQCETNESVKVVIGLFRASADPKHLLGLTRMRLDRITSPSPVKTVRLSVLISAPLQTWQPELFESSQREDRRQIALLVDRLSSRLGRNSVVRAVPQAESQPELAFRYEPLTGNVPRKTKQKNWKRLPRPLRLQNEPVSLEVMSVVPDGPPIQFQFKGLHRVAHALGPERIQTGWWHGRYVQRDYYRIETSTGKRFWLFRRLVDGKWFLHGVFD